MFIQITPKAQKPKNRETKEALEKDVSCSLVLAPFQPVPRVQLQSIVSEPAKCSLIVKNTSDRVLTVSVTKLPPPERSITTDACELRIEAKSSEVLLITWTPKEAGSWRDVVQLTDSRRIKYDVSIVTQATDPRKTMAKKKDKLKKPINQNPVWRNPPLQQSASQKVKQNFVLQECVPNKKFKHEETTPKYNKENIGNFQGNIMADNIEVDQNFSKLLESTPFQMSRFNDPNNFERPSMFSSTKSTADLDDSLINCQGVRYTDFKREFKAEAAKAEAAQVKTPHKIHSDISLLVNNLAFSPCPKTPQNQNKLPEGFSPQSCSTGSKSDNSKSFETDGSGVAVEISGSFNIDISLDNSKDRTYELSTSPRRSTRRVTGPRPIRLSTNFEPLSPVMPSQNQDDRAFEVISPMPLNKTFPKVAEETDTAKGILEANLWLNADVSPKAKSSCTKLNMISEEDFPINVTYEKEQSMEKRTNERKAQQKNFIMEISPPKVLHEQKVFVRKVSPTKSKVIQKEKIRDDSAASKSKQNLKKIVKTTNKIQTIPGVRISKLSLASLNKSKVAENKNNKTYVKEASVKLHDPNDYLMRFCNIDPFAASTTVDPFLTSTVYFDEKWMLQQEIAFKKWLNALLTPPEHLSVDVDTPPLDVGKVWQSCKVKEEVLAETKEAVSARYHTNVRLNNLRKAAVTMFRSDDVASVLSKATVCVEKETLVVRKDRDLHRDIGLQKGILELFLSYNPLWLRIGLETIYGETIPLHSNNDIVGMTRFLLTRFFTDPQLLKNNAYYAVPTLKKPCFNVQLSKFILKKFLFIVYFLDYAKNHKLIGHDPCLFHKRANYKDSRSILLTFAREVLGGVGDITKVLRFYGYVVTHKQTYLDEFDYAVVNLCVDLRDGVRLCRVMELITGKRNLTCRCRVPAISRLQKIHNVELSLTELLQSGYMLMGDIDAKCIIEGHREKTMSLLWQIIYKFQAPMFDKSARVLQKWWRANMWYVRVKVFLRRRKIRAAEVIQRAWKCHKARETLGMLKAEHVALMARRNAAARVIQTFWGKTRLMLVARDEFTRKREGARRIQRWWRRVKATRPFVRSFNEKREATVLIQCRWRETREATKQRNDFLILKEAARRIQSQYRANVAMRLARVDYLEAKSAAMLIQAKWRATKLKRADEQSYRQTLRSARAIQTWWRSVAAMKRERLNYLLAKNAVRTIESWWLKITFDDVERRELRLKKRKAIVIQRFWRQHAATKKDKQYLREAKLSCVKIQNWYRGAVQTRKLRNEFLAAQSAAAKIQNWWHGVLLTRLESHKYRQLKETVTKVQRAWRNKVLSRKARSDYLNLKRSVVGIQCQWRVVLARRKCEELKRRKNAAIVIQRHLRATLLAREQRESFVQLKAKTIRVQRGWRAVLAGRAERQKYEVLKKSTVVLQKNWRMIWAVQEYQKQRSSAIVIQTRWRARVLANKQRQSYETLRAAVIACQVQFRAKQCGRKVRRELEELRQRVIGVQRIWRAKLRGRVVRREYLELREAAIIVQAKWRMIVARKAFREQREAAVSLQNAWRLHRLTKKIRHDYVALRCAVILVQRRFRLKKQGRRAVKQYNAFRNAVISVQRRYREILTRREKERQAAVVIQRWYLSVKETQRLRQEFDEKKRACLVIQRTWRCVLHRRKFVKMVKDYKRAIAIVENWWIAEQRRRKICEMQRKETERRHEAATAIQSLWRGYATRVNHPEMETCRKNCDRAKNVAHKFDTVAVQLENCLEALKDCTSVGELTILLRNLDTLTRFLPIGCVRVCEYNFAEKIYTILSQYNKSLPYTHVCILCCSILITLAKYAKTKSYVNKIEYAETIARFLSITIEYGGLNSEELFLHLATLFWLLLEDPGYCLHVETNQSATWFLKQLNASLQKKKVPKGAQFSKNKDHQQQAILPNQKPDWGIDCKRPRLFTTVHHAVTSIQKRLQHNTRSNSSESLKISTPRKTNNKVSL